MGKEWPARSFKSGNSVAIRVPAELRFEPNRDWVLEERDGEFLLRRREAPKRKFNIAKVAGSATSLGYVSSEDRVFDERPSCRNEN